MHEGAVEVGRGFYRAHGLGNDYLVFEAAETDGVALTPHAIRRICRRGEGEGSDGLVVLLDRTPRDGAFSLRMFNPDGSEFERSGNGLRVLASWLRHEGLVAEEPFRVKSGGVEIPMEIHPGSRPGFHDVSVGMGRARIGDGAFPMDADRLDGDGRAVHPHLGPIAFSPVWVGNPHAVVFADPERWEKGQRPGIPEEDRLMAETARLGPFLTRHPAFPDGVNVQLAAVSGPGRIRIGIWERGVGATPASGTSSCAAVVAAVHGGRLDPGSVEVTMTGGVLRVDVTPELDVTLRGPVAEVATGRLTAGFAESLGRETGSAPG